MMAIIYSGKTGFYFVRSPQRAQYFLNSLLVSGDLIMATRTHQAPFLSVPSEHVSLHGLKVNILPGDEFPGGYQFQRRPRYMRQLLKDTAPNAEWESSSLGPYIFHMSWTENKHSKVQFFQQLGELYVNDSCLLDSNSTKGILVGAHNFPSKCCSAEPIIKCHYSDRPSKIPCLDSLKYANGKAFW